MTLKYSSKQRKGNTSELIRITTDVYVF